MSFAVSMVVELALYFLVGLFFCKMLTCIAMIFSNSIYDLPIVF